jgi:hypothetical protein
MKARSPIQPWETLSPEHSHIKALFEEIIQYSLSTHRAASLRTHEVKDIKRKQRKEIIKFLQEVSPHDLEVIRARMLLHIANLAAPWAIAIQAKLDGLIPEPPPKGE